MAKFELSLDKPFPDFPLNVDLVMPDGSTYRIKFTVHHKPLSELQKMLNDSERKVADLISELATGWSLKDEFSPENIEKLIDNYPVTSMKFIEAYSMAIAGQIKKA